MSKQEKKRLRQEAQVQKKRDWRERAKEKRHAAVIQRRAERIARLAAMSEAERAAAEAAEKAERDRLYQEKVAQSKRIDEAYESGLRVALDLSYSEHMLGAEPARGPAHLAPPHGARALPAGLPAGGRGH